MIKHHTPDNTRTVQDRNTLNPDSLQNKRNCIVSAIPCFQNCERLLLCFYQFHYVFQFTIQRIVYPYKRFRRNVLPLIHVDKHICGKELCTSGSWSFLFLYVLKTILNSSLILIFIYFHFLLIINFMTIAAVKIAIITMP